MESVFDGEKEIDDQNAYVAYDEYNDSGAEDYSSYDDDDNWRRHSRKPTTTTKKTTTTTRECSFKI